MHIHYLQPARKKKKQFQKNSLNAEEAERKIPEFSIINRTIGGRKV